MFSSGSDNKPTQIIRIPSYPATVNQLVEYVQQAKNRRNIKYVYTWEQDVPGSYSKKMSLTILCTGTAASGNFEWWMHEEATYGGSPPKMLWFHRTDDLTIIYPEILSSVGAQDGSRLGMDGGAMGGMGGGMGNSAPSKQRQKFGSLGERFGKHATTMDKAPQVPAAEILMEEAPAAVPTIVTMMSGNLRSRPISTIITTAAQHEATGHLFVEASGDRIVVQFGLGKPVHAVSMIRVGTEALLELFTWPDGECSFLDGCQPDSASIQEGAEQLLQIGDQYARDMRFLIKHELDECSILLRAPGQISEEQFEKRLTEGRPLGLKSQKDVYDNIYGSLALQQVADKLALGQSQWMAIVVNLLRLGLVVKPDGRSLENAPEEASKSRPGGFKVTDYQVTASFTRDGKDFGGGGPIPNLGGWTSSAPPTNLPDGFDGEKSGSFYTQESSGSYKRPEGMSKLSPPGTIPTTRPGDWGGSGDSGKSAAPMPPQFLFNRPGTDEQEITAVSGIKKRKLVCDVGVPAAELVLNADGTKELLSTLVRGETEIYSFEGVQFMMEREFVRAFRFSSVFSLMVFCIRLGSNPTAVDQPAVLPTSALHKITSAINDTKRDVDVFGHFGERTFALILPHVAASQAGALVDRIIKDLPERAPELAEFRPAFHFGIASVPQDKQDIAGLVCGAQQAMFEAVRRNIARVEFAELAAGAPAQAPAARVQAAPVPPAVQAPPVVQAPPTPPASGGPPIPPDAAPPAQGGAPGSA